MRDDNLLSNSESSNLEHECAHNKQENYFTSQHLFKTVSQGCRQRQIIFKSKTKFSALVVSPGATDRMTGDNPLKV